MRQPPESPVPVPEAPHPQASQVPSPPSLAPSSRGRLGVWLYALHLLSLASIALSNAFLGLTVLSTPWTLRRAQGERRWPPGSRPLLIALGAYILFLLASVIASYEPVRSLRATSEIFTLAAVPLGLIFLRRMPDVRRLVQGMILIAALIGGSGLVQFLLGYGDIDHRIRGPLSHYMTFSGILLIADALLLGRMATRDGWRRPWHWIALGLINIALLGSYTRSAWVGLLLALGVLLLLRAPRLLALLPAAALLFVALAPAPLLARVASITDLADASNYDRLCMARAGVTMIAERPVFGLGPDLVEKRYPLYRHPTAPRYSVPHLHNSFLHLAAERGIPALLAYLVMMGLVAGTALVRYRAEGGAEGPRADLYLGALLAVLAFNMAGLFENNWGDTEVQRFLLFILVLPYVAPEANGAPAASASPAPPVIL